MLFLGVNNCLRACLNSHKAMGTETEFFSFGRYAPECNFELILEGRLGETKIFFCSLLMFNAFLRCKQLPQILLEQSQGFGNRNWIFHLWP